MRHFKRLFRTLLDIYGDSIPPVREIRLALALGRVLSGEPLAKVCAELKLQRRRVENHANRVRAKDVAGLSVAEYPISLDTLAARRQGISQMLPDIITGGRVLKIEDYRPSRSDTDYRLLNGNGNPICRLNIKFHGTLFRDAARYVGLEPLDCFALATYKVWALAVLEGKRALEEASVDRLRSTGHRDHFRPIFERMTEGQFRIISAQKACKLLREKLFERVHALTLKGFTRRFRNAEVDMHFSLSTERTPIRTFLELLVRESPQKFAVSLCIGDY